MCLTHARRGGFSLIEIMTVIGIMGLLAAMAVGVYLTVGSGQSDTATKATLSKLAVILESRRSAITQPFSSPSFVVPPGIVSATLPDPMQNRARSVFLYMKLKNELPTTFSEATTDVSFGGETLRAKPAFKNRILKQNTLWSPSDTFESVGLEYNPADSQDDSTAVLAADSAAVLHILISELNSSGSSSDLSGFENQIAPVTVKLKRRPGGTGTPEDVQVTLPAFVDSWGQPIAFVRLAYSDELNNPPYAVAGSARSPSKDPYDSRAMLPPAGTWSPTTFWNAIQVNHARYPGFLTTDYPGKDKNTVLAVVSAGLNKKFGSLLGNDDKAFDNLISYRVTATSGKEGN
jgi:prepilin-type N-terminal cleavage/methylation domain-containing protein